MVKERKVSWTTNRSDLVVNLPCLVRVDCCSLIISQLFSQLQIFLLPSYFLVIIITSTIIYYICLNGLRMLDFMLL